MELDRRQLLITAAGTLATSSAAVSFAQAKAPRLADLTDQPSRSDLYEWITNIAIAKLQPDDDVDNTGGAYIPGDFTFPDDSTKDPKTGLDRVDYHWGVDVSHYSGRVDLRSLRDDKNIKFVYIKATQGTQFKDKKFAGFWSQVKALPKHPTNTLRRGAYHFLAAGKNGAAQADTFLNFVNSHGGIEKTDMPPVLDLEWDIARPAGPDRWKDYSPDTILESVKAWCAKVQEQTKRVPVIYTANAWWRERGIAPKRISELSDYGIWIADYSRSGQASEDPKVPGGAKWKLWQFSDKAKVGDAYKGGLDANVFKGTHDEFERFASQ
ncbi:hypothetical protein JQK88_34585 [Mesorhizobium caraganae]|uniref:glycoside hydrolase family 25 protein n=1 Tax=Mesorhizobium caraganae TaxID=483206 RepID=UPI0019396932|nr:GH25 family lysozyme [Mesorhizobium caraganae]MBM2716198.1 hypothetical protein [Mesorhizobium caraganae]